MCPLVQPGCWWACCQAGLGGGAPDAGSGPSLQEFPHGGADACTPRQGVTLLYGPSICTRSVQMDLRRNQVRWPFPTPGSGTLWVSGESLRDRRVSCLPRWTVCPTRSPSQDTNRSTCRGECSWSGPLATPPGRCHLGPLANGPGRNPPYCLRSGGADTDTGGGPKPLRSGTSPASFAGSRHPAPPQFAAALVPASQLSSPGASPFPAPLAVLPGSRHVPPAPAVCPCSGVLVSFVFCFFFSTARLSSFPPAFRSVLCPPPPHVPSLSPRCPRPFLGWVEEKGVGGGGRPRCPSSGVGTSQARRRHEARHLSLCWGGGGLAVWLPSSPYLSCGSTPGGPPVGACTARAPFGHGRVVRPAPSLRCLPTLPRCPRGGVRVPLPSSPLSPLSSSLCSTHVAGMTQARRKHRAWLQRWGGGGFPFGDPISTWSGTSPASHAGPCHPGLPPFAAVLVPVFSLSSSGALVCFVRGCFFFCLHRSPPVSSPGTSVCPLSPPHVPLPPPRCPRPFPWWVGEKGVGGGGGRPHCPSSGGSTSQARRRHEARHLSLCRGEGHAAWLPSSPFPPCVRSPGAPPAGACTARASFGHGRVVRPAPSLRCLPTLPLCPREGGPLSAPPFLHPPPLGGRRCVGGGGGALSSSLRCTHVTGTTQARRRHEARHPSLCRGGGHALWLPSSPFLPCARSPGGPPAGACTARALFGHGRVVRPAPSYRCLPTLLRCPRGGGSLFAPPPLPASPALGGAGVGGGGGAPMSSPLRCTHVAGTTQARHKHGVRHLAAAGGGGGVSLWAFPPFPLV